MRLFQAFVKEQTDKDWLTVLSNVDNSLEKNVIDELEKIKDTISKSFNNPLTSFNSSQNIAKVVAWLVLSHHRLPTYPKTKRNPDQFTDYPQFGCMNDWLEKNFDATWNSPSCKKERDRKTNVLKDWNQEISSHNWIFPLDTPLKSVRWQTHIREIAKKALREPRLFDGDWFNQRFTAHISRMALMLSDHSYSSIPLGNEDIDWQDHNSKAIANTDRKTGEIKQKLDDHNVGVGEGAYELAKVLPNLKSEFPSLKPNRTEFISKVKDQYSKKEQTKAHKQEIIKNFKWQDKALDLAKKLKLESNDYGFFGINMASTGKGKTRANAKIIYALADEKKGCRFSIALGLRTLTLQTARALEKHLKLVRNKDFAVLIGSQAVKELDEMANGSDSERSLMNDTDQVIYSGPQYTNALSEWIKHDEKFEKLIQAPVLVSTIDYLIPATEGTRGGKQIAPMLRLLTSDLILDEPDDFGLDDLPALCRLVNWAGMLGSKVLLSTATMPPALAYALFQSYQEGRRDYTQVNGEIGETKKICCAWFDEFATSKSKDAIISDFQLFSKHHKKFVDNRIKNISRENIVLRRARLLSPSYTSTEDPITSIAKTIHPEIQQLHNFHNQKHPLGKKVSIGLIRMANITPLVAVAKKLLSMSPKDNYRIHYCIYHSQYPLAIRSYIENKLDSALNRKNEKSIWLQTEIKETLENLPELNHIFVVIATSVAEVGRDHDYDWAIAEPSSMRSIIQLAGRIQRHRKKIPKTENLLILSKNVKALKNYTIAYNRPGFESNNLQLSSKDLNEILKEAQYKNINAISRIILPNQYMKEDKKYKNLVELEHKALSQSLFREDKYKKPIAANVWWKESPQWCGEVQKQQAFRKSKYDEAYYLVLKDENTKAFWQWKNEHVYPSEFGVGAIRIVDDSIEISSANNFWFNLNVKEIYLDLSIYHKTEIEEISKKFGEVRLVNFENNKQTEYLYHPMLGLYKEI